MNETCSHRSHAAAEQKDMYALIGRLINSFSSDKNIMMMNSYSTLNVTYIKPQQEGTSKYWAIQTLINNYLVNKKEHFIVRMKN